MKSYKAGIEQIMDDFDIHMMSRTPMLHSLFDLQKRMVEEQIIGSDEDVHMKINNASDEDLVTTLCENANNRLRQEQRFKLHKIMEENK